MPSAKTLVIIEAPGKLKKLRAILDASRYDIMASGGHVRDLPADRMGVCPPEFVPDYVATERGADRLKQLIATAHHAAAVVLATDPDREGEAIAWHLADALNLTSPQRVTYQSVEKQAVLDAMDNPRPLNMNLVHAQEARRVLDRLVGYGVSPVLGNHLGRRASAGRVQSPAVRLVVERERAIAAFVPVQHAGVTLLFTSAAGTWSAVWDTKPYRAEQQEHITDRRLAEAVAAVPSVVVRSIRNGEQAVAPPPPFTTTTLQRAAQVHMKLSVRETMTVAQELYERGFITYHRTDAALMSEEGFAQLAAYATAHHLPVVPARRTWKSKPGAQEAHEGIRPTHIEVDIAGETPAQQEMYRLIRVRALASQMADAVFAVRTAILEGAVDVNGQRPRFIARGRVLRIPGWKTVHDDTAAEKSAERDEADAGKDDEPSEEGNPVPAMLEGDSHTPDARRVRDQVTKPPPRFSESSLVVEMERLGIGRPATYAAIIDNIKVRAYIAVNAKKQLIQGPEGEAIVDALVGRFAFIDLAFTSEMEEHLDRIAQGHAGYREVVTQFHAVVAKEADALRQATMAAAPACPTCGKPLHLRTGKHGPFWACTGYPECKTTLDDKEGKPTARSPAQAMADVHLCPDCGKPMRRITVAKRAFWGCTGYWAKPPCKTTQQDDNGSPRQR